MMKILYKLITFLSLLSLILILTLSYIFEAQFKDIDYDGYKEIVILSESFGNRGAREYKAYNIGTFDLVIHFREDAKFNKAFNTVVNRWDSSACGSEEITYKAVDGVFKKIESTIIDQDWNTKICFKKVYKEDEFGELKLVSKSCSKIDSQGDWIKVDC